LPRIIDIYRRRRGLGATDVVAIISHALALTKENVYARFDSEVSDEESRRIETLLQERKQGKPLAYITKTKEFFSESFFVDERVLVPRPETELLVEEAAKILKKKGAASYIMDMGTGSGAIGCVLARELGHEVICVDVSLDALRVAQINAGRLNVSGRVALVCSDLWEGIKRARSFDMIVANLPYVPDEQWGKLGMSVKGFEPDVALKGGKEGVELYQRLVGAIRWYLKEDGHVLVEVDGRPQARRVREMIVGEGLRAKTKKDLSDRERVLIGSWKGL
jgi:release factor glutamine methyltransferase